MSRGQRPRTPKYFPRMKHRARGRVMRKLARARQPDGSILVRIDGRVYRVGPVMTARVKLSADFQGWRSALRDELKRLEVK